jgi:nucleoside-diphosphate-sugar epimerase
MLHGKPGDSFTIYRNSRMKILITGNLGYIGPVLTRHLKKTNVGHSITGIDTAFYAHCLTGALCSPDIYVDIQYFKDIRKVDETIFKGLDAVIHLAAVSNDPMGIKFEKVTDEINHQASVDLAKKASKAGVKKFVFASSCSIYGSSDDGLRKEKDTLNPLTAYAKSKVNAETGLEKLAGQSDMIVTALRFATACGMSDRIRLDLVLNDFVASAIATGKINVLSDGSPWRPLIDVKDIARAVEWALLRNGDAGKFLAINIGRNEFNYQVNEIAQIVSAIIPGTEIRINKNAPPDKRYYRVDFSLFKQLAPDFFPLTDIKQSAIEVRDGLKQMLFKDANFKDSQLIRLNVLEKHMAANKINNNLEWVY